MSYCHNYMTRNIGTGSHLLDGFIYNILPAVINLLSGILTGEEYILKQKKKDGNWRFNYRKAVSIGLTLLLVSLYPFWHFSSLPNFPEAISSLIISSKSNIVLYSEIILGFILATALQRTQRIEYFPHNV